jgi:hypothetical protein
LEAVRLVFLAELRRRWRSWLAIAILISVVSGLVLAATAAGRRTDSAFPRFVATHGFDAIVYANHPAPKVAKLPGVTSVTSLVYPFNGQPTCDCTHPINPSYFDVAVVSSKGTPVFNLLSGHMPDPSVPDQVLATFALQQDYGVRVGTVIRVPLYAASQASAIENSVDAGPNPRGPVVALHVVGIEATEDEFPTGGTPVYDVYVSQAFARTVLPRTALYYEYFVRLRRGVDDIPRFDAAVSSLNLGTGSGVGDSNEDQQAAAIEAAIHPQAIGWWILAALAALVGLAIVAQALSRQSIVESEDYPTMAALGVDRRQLVALGMVRNLVVGLAGAAGAIAIATALSPLAPLGEARSAETSTGVAFDTLVLPLGALAVVAVILALGVWPVLRAAHTLQSGEREVAQRPSAVVTYLAGVGASPTAVLGVRSALQRRSGGASVPVGSALLGTVLAVIALCGTAVFGASLSHLTATPKLYGDPFQLDFQPGSLTPGLVASLEHNRAVTAITDYAGGGEISVNKVLVGAIPATAVRGPLLFSTVDGHPPGTDDQIALGATTMKHVGAHLGSLVHVTLRNHTVPFRVVSQVSFPVIAGGIVSLGTGALITIPGLYHAACPPAEEVVCRQQIQKHGNNGILAGVASGPRGQAAISHYLNVYSSSATLRITPISLVNFGEAVNISHSFSVRCWRCSVRRRSRTSSW